MKTVFTTLIATIAITTFACGGFGTSDQPEPAAGDSESQAKIQELVNAAGEEKIATREATVKDQTTGEIEIPTKAIFIPTLEMQPTAVEFAKCLNDVSEEMSMLPWNHDIINQETGSAWRLGNYNDAEGEQASTQIFRLLHCRHLAPIVTNTDQINKCVVDAAKYIRESYPGASVRVDALLFALTVCIPPYED